MQVLQFRIKESPCILFRFDATLDKQIGKHRCDTQRGGQCSHLLGIALRLDYPSLFR